MEENITPAPILMKTASFNFLLGKKCQIYPKVEEKYNEAIPSFKSYGLVADLVSSTHYFPPPKPHCFEGNSRHS